MGTKSAFIRYLIPDESTFFTIISQFLRKLEKDAKMTKTGGTGKI